MAINKTDLVVNGIIAIAFALIVFVMIEYNFSARMKAYIILIAALILFRSKAKQIKTIFQEKIATRLHLLNIFRRKEGIFNEILTVIAEKNVQINKIKLIINGDVKEGGFVKKLILFDIPYFLKHGSVQRKAIEEIAFTLKKIDEKDNTIFKLLSKTISLTDEEKGLIGVVYDINIDVKNGLGQLRRFFSKYNDLTQQQLVNLLSNTSEREQKNIEFMRNKNKIVLENVSELLNRLNEQRKEITIQKKAANEILKAKDDVPLRPKIPDNLQIIQRSVDRLSKLSFTHNARIKELSDEIINERKEIEERFREQQEKEKTEIITDEKLKLLFRNAEYEMPIGEIEEEPETDMEKLMVKAGKMAKTRRQITLRNIIQFIEYLHEGRIGALTETHKQQTLIFIKSIPGSQELAAQIQREVTSFGEIGVKQLSEVLCKYFNLNPITYAFKKKV